MAISGKTCYVKELWKKIVYAIMKKKKKKKKSFISIDLFILFMSSFHRIKAQLIDIPIPILFSTSL